MVADRERWPGRSYDGASKTWTIPDVSLEEFQKAIESEGWQLLTSEDERLDAEIAEIERLQKEVCWNAVEIQLRAGWEKATADSYSYNSKSRHKAAALRAFGCLSHALNYANKPIEELAEPEIATLRSAIKRIEEYGRIALKDLLIEFSFDPSKLFGNEVFEEKIIPRTSVSLREVPKKGDDYLTGKYVADLEMMPEVAGRVFPDVELTERFAPDGQLAPVVRLKVKE
ncbi:MAG: hypothetical protein WBB01_06455 [Phormidesmis sp.]